MKLRNKKTGEIVEVAFGNYKNLLKSLVVDNDNEPGEPYGIYNSLAELNEEWEDYEEPKEHWWYIDNLGVVNQATFITVVEQAMAKDSKAIGNYFETKEEAEKAVEKLKAFKILKDNGFKFNAWYGGSKVISFSIPQEIIGKSTAKDLNLLFGGEE